MVEHPPVELTPEMKSLEQRALVQGILDRYQMMRMAGISFDGKRDTYEVLGYKRVLTARDYTDRYYRGGIAARIVDAFPNATWRGEVEVIEDEDPKKETEFEKAWLALEVKFQLVAKLLRSDKLAGLSTFAVIHIGAPGGLDQPLPKGKPEDLLYFTPYLGGGGPSDGNTRSISTDADCMIAEYETNPENARFGLPLYYQLRRRDGVQLAQLPQTKIHHSRILHIAEGLLTNDSFGLPTLERVWNLLDDLDKVTGGGAEAFWLRANQGLHVNVDKDTQLPVVGKDGKTELEKLAAQLENYSNGMTRWIRTRGVDINTLGSDTANFNSPADAVLTQIAGSTSIPKRILTGSEMGELASSQDRENWRDQVTGRRNNYAEPYIMRALVDRLILNGYLPSPAEGPRAYKVVWPVIEALTTEEKMKIGTDLASINSTQKRVLFTSSEIREVTGRPPLTPEQLEEEKKEREASGGEAGPGDPNEEDKDKKTRALQSPSLYRGLVGTKSLEEEVLELQVGDVFNVQRPTLFTRSLVHATKIARSDESNYIPVVVELRNAQGSDTPDGQVRASGSFKVVAIDRSDSAPNWHVTLEARDEE